jgi:hypothetical protein
MIRADNNDTGMDAWIATSAHPEQENNVAGMSPLPAKGRRFVVV